MLGSFFKHRGKYKRFEYTPRYYDPTKEERRKRRIKFRRVTTKRKDRQPLMVFVFAAALFFVVWMILKLG